MALPISIEQLLGSGVVESSRIEYKEGWNPDAIYRTICAFANDFDNIGGGYIVVGVEEKNGRAVRPVKGLDIEKIEPIEKDMIGFNNLIKPLYVPKTSIEDIDGKKVFVIWVPGGLSRPYEVPECVTAKEKKHKEYIRYNSSSIEAKGDLRTELFDLTARIPFDDMPNHEAKLSDISRSRVFDYLNKVGSKLTEEEGTKDFKELLEQMNLVAGPPEALYPRNCALMMFNDHPEKFFPYMQADITVFPKGKLNDPDNFIEVPTIYGPVDSIIDKVLGYLKTNIIKEAVSKVPGRMEAKRYFNYPYEALEEIVCNAFYHRDYREHEPVNIVIEPDFISVSNVGGPDRAVKMEDFESGTPKPRRYRNRRLGDFLKELDLTEGKSTGITTVRAKLKSNGSPAAIYEFDEERTYFSATVKIHPEFPRDTESPNVPHDVPHDVPHENPRLTAILDMISADKTITREQMAANLNVSKKTIGRDLKSLAEIVRYVGSGDKGHWERIK